MKLRVKATNETLPVAEDSFICGLRPDGCEVEFVVSDVELIPDNWDAFRIEAAKDLLPLATQMKDYRGFPEQCVSLAIQLADELIKQLKKNAEYEH